MVPATSTRFPSVVVFLRVYYGSYTDLNEMFFPSYYHFWPRKEFWPNTLLVLVWDKDSNPDLDASKRLHQKWDPLLRRKELPSATKKRPRGTKDRNNKPTWLDLYEEQKPANVVCGMKKSGARDRPSSRGYIQQAQSYLEADTLLQHPSFLEHFGHVKPDDLYIMLTDADMSFLSPIHPLVLFDHKNGRYLPRVHAAWGRRPEGDISFEASFREAPPVADFMDQQPWILRAGDFPSLRERLKQAIFSNLHRFFIVSSYAKRKDLPPSDDPPIAWLRWRSSARKCQRHSLLRFAWQRPARPLSAFYEPRRYQVHLPFSDMEIAWIPKANTTTVTGFTSFTWATAMGILYRCAHPLQAHSRHDRSAAHVNLLFNNLFWFLTSQNLQMTDSKSPMPYRFLFRRVAFFPDTNRPDLFISRRTGYPSVDDLYGHYIWRNEFQDGTRLLQSLPFSRFQLDILRQHDLSTSAGTTKALRELVGGPQRHTCSSHSQGFKVLKHWYSMKTVRKEAEAVEMPEDAVMPRMGFAQAQICLYWKAMPRRRTEGLRWLSNISALCESGIHGWRLCDKRPPQLLSEEIKCEDKQTTRKWECPEFQMLCEDSFWRLTLILNHYIDLNPYLGLPCRVPYQMSKEIEEDRLYLSNGHATLVGGRGAAANKSIRSRINLDELKEGMNLNFFQESLVTCEIFDLAHMLQCHLEQLKLVEKDSIAWTHWLTGG